MSKRGYSPLPKKVLLARLHTKIDTMLREAEVAPCPELGSPCLHAKGVKNAAGYVLMGARGLGFSAPCCAHVASYCLANDIDTKSKIPRDPGSVTGRKHIHHLCATYARTDAERKACRGCISPTHLQALTRRQNQAAIPEEVKLANAAKMRAGHVPRVATCHPSRKHHAKSLCQSCYLAQPVVIAKTAARHRCRYLRLVAEGYFQTDEYKAKCGASYRLRKESGYYNDEFKARRGELYAARQLRKLNAS